MLQIVFQTSETACHAEGNCRGVDGNINVCAVGFSCPTGTTVIVFRELCQFPPS